MFAKSIERFIVLFPTALVHIVACQQHPDKYWPGGEGVDGQVARPVQLQQVMLILGVALPAFMSAQTSVILDTSTFHSVKLTMACCVCNISLDGLEELALFLFRISEFTSRIIVISYLWYGLDSCSFCPISYCTCSFRWIALPAVCLQFLVTLIVTSASSFWMSLCNEAPRSLSSTLDVIFNMQYVAGKVTALHLSHFLV
jgi:hypothetical protein